MSGPPLAFAGLGQNYKWRPVCYIHRHTEKLWIKIFKKTNKWNRFYCPMLLRARRSYFPWGMVGLKVHEDEGEGPFRPAQQDCGCTPQRRPLSMGTEAPGQPGVGSWRACGRPTMAGAGPSSLGPCSRAPALLIPWFWVGWDAHFPEDRGLETAVLNGGSLGHQGLLTAVRPLCPQCSDPGSAVGVSVLTHTDLEPVVRDAVLSTCRECRRAALSPGSLARLLPAHRA